ncbi:undecaprenyl/decaprenyl-phosphate alpha-N-acetylglucosaminyl 1-phosphate transferase [Oceanobacillus caeni]|uniref:UDP-phosphate N-acetylglucosaminyl 1-phosphate transferase n=1 Tax=Oceanobacillus caeni TaxID=405946 RepID=A0ABR5MHJ7_9BACI|nr:MraY family glycosyltransferase [Oceanobacillus caeni]KKE80450.1 UDP-phosphate N-acetylglucosaminyl 1-phosphate transferase [Bacilli bacterium VT-13-104]PZD83347.1 undecaprenyl/decaprenyl-phosphate alpha-N-acetylglucosaminyl 1-phosphate transferase [Bacilli bacterium]KPH73456.1 UDP-phosphate N-acetylglucosaminyl 1-phosphate transferase [Oceanobacillus caeni]MBU8789959.1 undecaprenyl/decaprenyl-phosphate alpha-N-acetylglucosaminyl 1-phosphate transferase [Oceanobacillus caeni]MCR1834308.1 un
MLYIALIVSFFSSIIITPIVKRFALKIGATDQPNERKVHTSVMPRLGGLAIFLSFIIGIILFYPNPGDYWPILVGGTIIILTGILDDIFTISAKYKLLGQIIAALVTVLGGIQIEFVTIWQDERIYFEFFAIPITIIWIVAITNAINLIDGLDGLAAGVSSIALFTISVIAITRGDILIAFLGLVMLGSTVGFLVYNFYPAKIFMGDTGSLFLGYMISVVSVLGLYKEVTIVSLIIPIIILGIPIMDTTFAIIRRIVQGRPLSSPDKFHLHHCIIRLGFTHRQTVIMIYALSILFSVIAIVLTRSTLWGSISILVSLLILVELIVEITGVISDQYRPILNLIGWKK